MILSWVAYLEPTFDFRLVVREWSREAQKELDFGHEASIMEEVAANLRAYVAWMEDTGRTLCRLVVFELYGFSRLAAVSRYNHLDSELFAFNTSCNYKTELVYPRPIPLTLPRSSGYIHLDVEPIN